MGLLGALPPHCTQGMQPVDTESDNKKVAPTIGHYTTPAGARAAMAIASGLRYNGSANKRNLDAMLRRRDIFREKQRNAQKEKEENEKQKREEARGKEIESRKLEDGVL